MLDKTRDNETSSHETAKKYIDLLFAGYDLQIKSGQPVAARSDKGIPEDIQKSLTENSDFMCSLIADRNALIDRIKVQRHEIDKREVFIVDNLMSNGEMAFFHPQIYNQSYRLGEQDFDGDEYPIFSAELNKPFLLANYIFTKRVIELLKHHFPMDQHRLSRCYVNLCQYGHMEYPHRDCDEEDTNVTALYYANSNWKLEYGGETHFYDTENETSLAVQPKPGRLVLFRGAILHVGTIPTRTCTEPRYSVAFKF